MPMEFGPYLPSEYDREPIGGPPLAPVPGAGVNILSPPGSMPIGQQEALIAEIKRMSQSKDMRERIAAQKFMDEWGRNMGAVYLNKATQLPFGRQMGIPGGQGLSDTLMMMGQDRPNNYYSPGNMDFSKRLTGEVRPAANETAEALGNATNLGLSLLGLRRAIRGPGGPGSPPGPPPRSPGVPLIPPDLPSPLSPSPSAPPPPPGGPPEMQGPPQWPQFLERWRRGEPQPGGPPPTDRPTLGETRYGDFLDTGQPTPQWRLQNRGADGRFQKGKQEFEDVQRGGYDPFSLRNPRPPGSRRFRPMDDD